MATNSLRLNKVGVAALVAALVPVAGLAGEFDYALKLGVGRTDNIRFLPTGKESANLLMAGTEFSYLQETRLLRADVAGDLAYHDYSGNVYSGRLAGAAQANVSLQLVEDRLRWVVSDNFGQTARDLTSARTPDNLELVNYFSTGPEARLRLGGDLELQAQARYALVDFEHSPLDSDRLGGEVALAYSLGQGQVSLHAGGEKISARNESPAPDTRRLETFARYAAKGARTDVQVDAGASRIKQSSVSTSGGLFRVIAKRTINEGQSLTLAVGRVVTDAGDALGAQLDFGGSVFQAGDNSLNQTADPYVNRYVSLGWAYEGSRTSLDLTGTLSDEHYFWYSPQADRQRYEGSVRFARQVGPRLQVGAGFRYASDEFDGQATKLNERNITANIRWQASRSIFLELLGERYRFSSVAVATENRVWLQLRYGPGEVRRYGE